MIKVVAVGTHEITAACSDSASDERPEQPIVFTGDSRPSDSSANAADCRALLFGCPGKLLASDSANQQPGRGGADSPGSITHNSQHDFPFTRLLFGSGFDQF